MSQKQKSIHELVDEALRDEAIKCEQESKAFAAQNNFAKAAELQALSSYFKNVSKAHKSRTGKAACA